MGIVSARLRPRRGQPVLQPVRGGGREHPARRRAARPAAPDLARRRGPRPRDPDLRAGGRPDHARPDPAPEPQGRHAGRAPGRLRAGVGARRRRRLHRGGGRLPRALPRRGADGAGAAALRRAARLLPQPRRRRCRGLRGCESIHHYLVEVNRLENEGDRLLRDGARVPVRERRRPDVRDPLEGHLRAARAGDRRLRDGREHPRVDRRQERLSRRDPGRRVPGQFVGVSTPGAAQHRDHRPGRAGRGVHPCRQAAAAAVILGRDLAGLPGGDRLPRLPPLYREPVHAVGDEHPAPRAAVRRHRVRHGTLIATSRAVGERPRHDPVVHLPGRLGDGGLARLDRVAPLRGVDASPRGVSFSAPASHNPCGRAWIRD